MIIGAAGGNEILASLYFDAGHIDAIELNPVTHDLVTDDFADYAGHLAEDPDVNYVQGDGAVVPRPQRRHVRPRLVPGAGQLLGHQRGHAPGPSCCPRATCTPARPSRRASTTSATTGSSPPSTASSTTRTSPTAPARYVATARAGPRRHGASTTRRDHILVATTPAEAFGGIALDDPGEGRRPFTDGGGRPASSGGRGRRRAGRPPVRARPATPRRTRSPSWSPLPDDELDDVLRRLPLRRHADHRRRAVLLALHAVRRRDPRLRRPDRPGRPRDRHRRAGAAPPARRGRSLFAAGVPAAAVRRHPGHVAAPAPQGPVGRLLRRARAGLPVLRDHADPAADRCSSATRPTR